MATTDHQPHTEHPLYFFSDHSSDYDSDSTPHLREDSDDGEEEEEDDEGQEDIVTLQNATLENWKINASLQRSKNAKTTNNILVKTETAGTGNKGKMIIDTDNTMDIIANTNKNIQINTNNKIESNNSIHLNGNPNTTSTAKIATPTNPYTKAIPMPKTPIMAKNIALSKTTPLRSTTFPQTNGFGTSQTNGHLSSQTPSVSPYQNFATTRLLPGFGLGDVSNSTQKKSFSARNTPAKSHPSFPVVPIDKEEPVQQPCTPLTRSLDEITSDLSIWTSQSPQDVQSKPMFLPQTEPIANSATLDSKISLKSPLSGSRKTAKKQTNKTDSAQILATPERSTLQQFPCEPSPVHKFVPQSPLIESNDGTGSTPSKSFPKIKPPPFLAKWTKNAQENAAKKTQHMMVLMQQQKEQQNQQNHQETSTSTETSAKDKRQTAEARTQIRNNNLAGIHTQDHPGSCNVPSCPKNAPVPETQPEAIPLDATELLKDVSDSSPPTSISILNNAAQSKWDRIPIGTFRRSRRRSKPHIKVNFAGNASGVLLSGVNKTLFQQSDIELQQEWEDERNTSWNYQIVKERKRERKRKLSIVEDIRIMASDPLFDAFQGLWQEGVWDNMDI